MPLVFVSARRCVAFALVLSAMSSSAAIAQTEAAPDALFDALGGKAGIARIVDGFVPRLAADARFGAAFEHTQLKELSRQLADQFCSVAGGPCRYEGATMKAAHAGLAIRRADFNRSVELLQDAMDACGVPFAVQNRLLARLAPMHRDIVDSH